MSSARFDLNRSGSSFQAKIPRLFDDIGAALRRHRHAPVDSAAWLEPALPHVVEGGAYARLNADAVLARRASLD